MYLDNDAARAGLIKMRGATDIGDCFIQDAAELEAKLSAIFQAMVWSCAGVVQCGVWS